MHKMRAIRFIPVHTGNAHKKKAKKPKPPVHPRAYGERLSLESLANLNAGSSPCIRGTLTGEAYGVGVTRFIPVHTGNAGYQSEFTNIFTVHPRAYGERLTFLKLALV